MKHRGDLFLYGASFRHPNSRLLVEFLEDRNLTHTGPDLKFFQLTRETLLVAASCCGMLLPQSQQAYSLRDLAGAEKRLPLVVKPDWELGCAHSRQDNFIVEKAEDLEVVAETVIEQFGGAVLEEFVGDREFVCLCYSKGEAVKSMRPVEFDFSSGARVVTEALRNDPLRRHWYGALGDETL